MKIKEGSLRVHGNDLSQNKTPEFSYALPWQRNGMLLNSHENNPRGENGIYKRS